MEDILTLDYLYDNANNITQINDKTYEYDKINQLTKYVKPGRFLETKKAPGKHGHRPGDCEAISPLDFSVENEALIHLDYNSTSIGLDLGRRIIRVKKILLIPDEEHQTHRITDASIELYHSDYNSQYQFIPRNEWEYSKDESGIITITLDQVITSRYLKLNVLYDERDKEFTPVDRVEFMNTLAAMLEVYHEATSWTEEYEYDSCGNRTLHRVTLVQADVYESAYYENSNRIKTDGNYAYTYDEAGNLVEKGNRFEIDDDEVVFTETDGEGVEYWEYTYDLLNRLTYVKKNGSIAAEYGYDPLDYRVVKKAGGQVIHYVFEGTEPVFEKNVSKGEIKSYVYVLGRHLARVDGVIVDSGASVWFIHTDHLGSVRAVSNSEGEVVWSTDYKPFGELFGQQDEGFDEWYGFTGKEWDADVGLYYFNARWYDSSTGRFISEDPVRDTCNWYVYAGNNPLLYIDPDGLEIIVSSALQDAYNVYAGTRHGKQFRGKFSKKWFEFRRSPPDFRFRGPQGNINLVTGYYEDVYGTAIYGPWWEQTYVKELFGRSLYQVKGDIPLTFTKEQQTLQIAHAAGIGLDFTGYYGVDVLRSIPFVGNKLFGSNLTKGLILIPTMN